MTIVNPIYPGPLQPPQNVDYTDYTQVTGNKIPTFMPPTPILQKGTLRIGPHDFEVIFEVGLLGEDEVGLCVMRDLAIHIHPDLTGTLRAETLLHEVIHAIWALNALDDAPEETATSTIAAALLQVFRDNEWFAKEVKG